MTRDEKIAQARTWKAAAWDTDAIADELDVSETTVKKWIDEEYRKACIARSAAWRRGPGKEKRRMIVRRYRERRRAREAEQETRP
jgi:transposase